MDIVTNTDNQIQYKTILMLSKLFNFPDRHNKSGYWTYTRRIFNLICYYMQNKDLHIGQFNDSMIWFWQTKPILNLSPCFWPNSWSHSKILLTSFGLYVLQFLVSFLSLLGMSLFTVLLCQFCIDCPHPYFIPIIFWRNSFCPFSPCTWTKGYPYRFDHGRRHVFFIKTLKANSHTSSPV